MVLFWADWHNGLYGRCERCDGLVINVSHTHWNRWFKLVWVILVIFGDMKEILNVLKLRLANQFFEFCWLCIYILLPDKKFCMSTVRLILESFGILHCLCKLFIQYFNGRRFLVSLLDRIGVFWNSDLFGWVWFDH